MRVPRGRSRPKEAAREKLFLETSRSARLGSERTRPVTRPLARSPARPLARSPAGPGAANYYLIARITEYNNNGPRPLKAAATTPGINEP